MKPEDFNFTERKRSEVLQKPTGHIKCASCGRLVSRLAAVCPECKGATHPKAAVPWFAVIIVTGIVGGTVWLTVDYIRSEREKQYAIEILEKANRVIDRAAK